MKKYFFLLTILTCISSFSFSQYSVSAGPTFIRPFGYQGIYPGLHIGVELNDDDFQTLYGRFSFLPYKSGDSTSSVVQGIDINTNPYTVPVSLTERYNYSMLEFGKRYYFGDGYESGFGFYGGSTINLIFNSIKYRVGEYDKTKYFSSFDESQKGSIVSFGLGLNGGIKNSFSFGTLFFDAGLSYSLLQIGSPNLNSLPTPESYRSLLFTFNLGFRKDFY